MPAYVSRPRRRLDAKFRSPLRGRFAALLLAASALALGACGSSGGGGTASPPAPLAPAPPPAAVPVVNPGELFVSDQGIAVGAPAGSLSAPVELRIERIAWPAIALPAGLEAIDGAVHIGAVSADVDPEPGTQFVIGFVLPAGEDPDQLDIAVVLPADSMLDGPGVAMWTTLGTAYSEAYDIVYTGAVGLPLEGDIYALVRRAAVAAPARVANGAVNAAKPGDSRLQDTRKTEWNSSPSPLVEARCSNEFYYTQAVCGSDERLLVEQAFEELYTELVSAGYPLPRLRRRTTVTQPADPAAPLITEYGPFEVLLRPCEVTRAFSSGSSGGYDGVYSPADEVMEVCIATGESSRETTRHELFHAIQHAFESVLSLNGPVVDEWFIEGTAAAAEHSDLHTMRRTPHQDWRVTHHSLLERKFTDELGKRLHLEYAAQDFWVYLGHRLGRGLDLLLPFLQRGPLAEHVDATLRETVAEEGLSDLSSAYFSWARNQTFEASVVLPNGIAGPELVGGHCQVQEFDRIDGLRVATGAKLYVAFRYDPDQEPGWVSSNALGLASYEDGRLEFNVVEWDEDGARALTANMVGFDLEAPRDYIVRVSVESEDPQVQYKIYAVDSASTASSECHDEPADPVRYFNITQGSPQQFAVLVAWTGLSDEEHRQVGSASQLPVTKVVIERVSLHLEPSSATHEVTENGPVLGRFRIHNGTPYAISYTASPQAPWLAITQSEDGVVPAHGYVEIEYEVSCGTPGASAASEIQLTFRYSNGAILSGDDVPTTFLVSQTCESFSICLPAAPHDYAATVTLTWGGSGSRVSTTGSTTVTREVTASISMTLSGVSPFGAPAVASGTATADILSSTTTETDTTSSYQILSWQGAGEASGGSSGESPPALSINYNHTTCTWGIGVSGTLDVEYTANSNGNVSTTDQRIHVATVSPQAASGLPMSGSTLLPICYVYSPSCNPVTAGAAEFYFLNQTGYSHDDPNVPPIVLNWSITATPVQVE